MLQIKKIYLKNKKYSMMFLTFYRKIIEMSKYGRDLKKNPFSSFVFYLFPFSSLFSFPFFFPSFKILGGGNFPSNMDGARAPIALPPPEYAPVCVECVKIQSFFLSFIG